MNLSQLNSAPIVKFALNYCSDCEQLYCFPRLILTKEHIQWADILVPVGGDGTFLLTAGRASVFDPNATVSKTPLVGFNSDPLRSEGRLMLPKKYSYDPEEAVRRIFEVSKQNYSELNKTELKFFYIFAG